MTICFAKSSMREPGAGRRSETATAGRERGRPCGRAEERHRQRGSRPKGASPRRPKGDAPAARRKLGHREEGGQVRAIHCQLQGLVVGLNPVVIAPQDTERQKEQPKLKFACYRSSWFAHVPTRLIWL